MDRIYFPSQTDRMWNAEVASLIPYIDGVGLDIGCGDRTLREDVYTLDIDPERNPDFVGSGDAIPLPDESFDFVYGIHSFEHFEDQEKTLKEWLRVVKKGGIVAMVHPDIDYTKKQNPQFDKAGLMINPHNKHWHEKSRENFVKWIRTKRKYGFEVYTYGEAMTNWSFYVILKKNGERVI